MSHEMLCIVHVCYCIIFLRLVCLDLFFNYLKKSKGSLLIYSHFTEFKSCTRPLSFSSLSEFFRNIFRFTKGFFPLFFFSNSCQFFSVRRVLSDIFWHSHFANSLSRLRFSSLKRSADFKPSHLVIMFNFGHFQKKRKCFAGGLNQIMFQVQIMYGVSL